MARIGLSKPVFAKYSNTGTTVSYSDASSMGKAVELDLALESSDANNLYADNVICESDNQFAGGTATVTTDDLDPAKAATIFGIVSTDLTISGMTTTNAKKYVFNNEQNTPYLGFGAVAKAKINGVIKYRPIVLNKIMFKNPSETFTTQGETISWQTSKIEATILRDDSTTQDWKSTTSWLDTENDAVLYIASILGTF